MEKIGRLLANASRRRPYWCNCQIIIIIVDICQRQNVNTEVSSTESDIPRQSHTLNTTGLVRGPQPSKNRYINDKLTTDLAAFEKPEILETLCFILITGTSIVRILCVHCCEAVGWATGRASTLQ